MVISIFSIKKLFMVLQILGLVALALKFTTYKYNHLRLSQIQGQLKSKDLASITKAKAKEFSFMVKAIGRTLEFQAVFTDTHQVQGHG